MAKLFLIQGADPSITPQHMASQMKLSCTGTFFRPSFLSKEKVRWTAQIGPTTTRKKTYSKAKVYSRTGCDWVSQTEDKPAFDIVCDMRSMFMIGAVTSPRSIKIIALNNGAEERRCGMLEPDCKVPVRANNNQQIKLTSYDLLESTSLKSCKMQ